MLSSLQLAVLFKIFATSESSGLSRDDMQLLFKRSAKENGFSLSTEKFQELLDYLFEEVDPERTGFVTKQNLMGE
jgi:hypothetical protein